MPARFSPEPTNPLSLREMSLPKISVVTGSVVHVPGDDIDTDRIIPARFMKCLTFDGLGEYLFHDTRFNEDGSPKKHNLNDPRFAGAGILVTGSNFGCGSSREHAPQSLYRAGFRAIIAGNFAEIFFGNSINLGMPCVSVESGDRAKIVAEIEKNPKTEATISLEDLSVRFGQTEVSCRMRSDARESLASGRWDPLDELLSRNPEVESLSSSLHYK